MSNSSSWVHLHAKTCLRVWASDLADGLGARIAMSQCGGHGERMGHLLTDKEEENLSDCLGFLSAEEKCFFHQ